MLLVNSPTILTTSAQQPTGLGIDAERQSNHPHTKEGDISMNRLHLLLGIFIFSLVLVGCKKDESGPTEPPAQSFSEQKQISESTVGNYKQLLQSSTPRQARATLVNNLRQTNGIVSAGLSRDSITIWWKMRSGIEVCLFTETRASLTDTSGGDLLRRNVGNHEPLTFLGLPHNRNALILSPYQWDWNLLGIIPLADETGFINSLLSTAGYSTVFKVNQRKSDQNVSLNDFQQFSQYGTIVISSHGGVNSNGDVIIATGVIATDQLYNQYLADLRAGNLVLVVYIDKWFTEQDILAFAITPGWIRKYYPQKLDSTLFYASVCKGSFNSTMSSTIVGSGAGYFSWTQSVGTGQATRTGKDLFTQLVSRALNCQDALTAVQNNGNGTFTPPIWSTEPIANFTYAGDPQLRLVDRPLRIAITPPYWDDIASLLRSFNYQVSTISLTQLADSNVTRTYDIIGINCAAGLSTYATQASTNLRRFVSSGGRLYASDYAYAFVNQSFPGYVTFPSNPYVGTTQTVAATVTDSSLAGYLGVTQVQVTYDLDAWVVIDGVGSSTSILLSGDVSSSLSASASPSSIHRGLQSISNDIMTTIRPLAVSFRYGSGRVVFTTFHNEAQISEPVRHLLEYFTVLR